jgi:phosphate-selective porin OprO and OprP
MFRNKMMLIVSSLVLVALTGVVRADETTDTRVASLEAQVAELRAEKNGKWLNERRAEEIKGLMHEVLADADTRASLLQDGAVAGHNGNHFFIGSADGAFLMQVFGQTQFRYNHMIDSTSSDETDSGFHLRRAKIGFKGHVQAGRKWDYTMILGLDSTPAVSQDIEVYDVIVGTELKAGLRVDVGITTLPFLREELTDSSHQLAVERSLFNEFFSLNRSEQIRFQYTPKDDLKIAVSISDGSNTGQTPNGGDAVDFAITTRVDWKVAGDWSQAADYTAWTGESKAVFVGGAFHYQAGDGGNGNPSDYFAWTLDASLEMNKFGLAAAIAGATIDPDSGADTDLFGVMVQASYLVKEDLEPFARLEWMDDDSLDETVALTLGANHYIKKHNAKFTLDVVMILDADTSGLATNPMGTTTGGSPIGWAGGVGEDSAVVRAQLQLLF